MGLRLYDSCFFVDLDREHRRSERGPATAHLEQRLDDEMAMSVITRGELARGFLSRETWDAFCGGYLLLQIDDETLWIAAETFRFLRKNGIPISDNDLWIGATAIRNGLELVTNNVRHFARIPDLRLFLYR